MAENIENNGCSQRDNAEHEGYVKASRSFNRIWKERDSAQPRLLETILYKDNFNRAYKRVKANKGAPGIDGMTIEEALPYLKEHQQELTDRWRCLMISEMPWNAGGSGWSTRESAMYTTVHMRRRRSGTAPRRICFCRSIGMPWRCRGLLPEL